MRLSALLLVLSIGFFLPTSFANIVYSKVSSTPVDKEKPLKKPKKQQTQSGNRSFTSGKTIHSHQAAQAHTIGIIFSWIGIVALLLLGPAFFIVGGLSGGIGWFIIGSIIVSLWLGLSFVIVALKASYIYSTGLAIFIIFAVAFISFLVWALVAALPLLLVLSIIFGVLSLIGLLIYGINEIAWKNR